MTSENTSAKSIHIESSMTTASTSPCSVNYQVEPDESSGLYKHTMTIDLPELTATRYRFPTMHSDDYIRSALRREICELVDEIMKGKLGDL